MVIKLLHITTVVLPEYPKENTLKLTGAVPSRESQGVQGRFSLAKLFAIPSKSTAGKSSRIVLQVPSG